jgi:hypothetical protein
MFFFYLEEENGIPLAMKFQRSEQQLVCKFIGLNCVFVFLFFIYIYKGWGRLLWQCNSRGVSS